MTWEVVVVGGGPVGLLLGARLVRLGIDCVVLEAEQRATGSRAIGIHPPSLAMLEMLGVLRAFLREGVRIERAHAFTSRRKLGAVDLRRAGDRFGFVLSLPQERTEALLESALGARLIRGVRVCDLEPHAKGIDVIADSGRAWDARWVVGCDGGRSLVASSIGATLAGERSPATFAMGDFDDRSGFGNDAAIFLTDEGLVESFPLPEGRRRWVIELEERCAMPRAAEIADTDERRTGQQLISDSGRLLSAFGVQQLCATRWWGPRRIVAGDAAHLISPFGGQGMNVGWADAWDVAACLERMLRQGADSDDELAGYTRRRRRAARRAMHRAAFNGAVGRRNRYPRARNAAVGALLRVAPQPWLARLFTMQSLLGASADRRSDRHEDHGDPLAVLVVGEPRAGRQP